MPDIEVRRYDGAPDLHLAAQVQTLYEASFPAEQRAVWADIVEALKGGRSTLYTAQEGSRAVGFALTTRLPDTGVLLLDYLAVAPEERSQGIGSALVRRIVASLRGEPGARGILLEVEPPEEIEGVERTVRERRVAFYERNGAVMVDDGGAYRMPNLTAEGSIPMRLMWLPLNATDAVIPRSRLAACVRAILTIGYGLPPDNPLLRAILRGLPRDRAGYLRAPASNA